MLVLFVPSSNENYQILSAVARKNHQLKEAVRRGLSQSEALPLNTWKRARTGIRERVRSRLDGLVEESRQPRVVPFELCLRVVVYGTVVITFHSLYVVRLFIQFIQELSLEPGQRAMLACAPRRPAAANVPALPSTKKA
jgi:hypothetical protein